MRIAYLDCFSGISGDMFLSALLDAGLPESELRKILSQIGVAEHEVQIMDVEKRGIHAKSLLVTPDEKRTPLAVSDIKKIFSDSSLPEKIKNNAVKMFDMILSAEASVHGCDENDVHLHEISGLDTVVDIIGAAFGVQYLNISEMFASPPEVGSGMIRIAHGEVSIPAPATMVLLTGVPIRADGLPGERVTPTGAAILRSFVKEYRSIPPMTVRSVGHGAGKLDSGPRPNILRILLGDETNTSIKYSVNFEKVMVLETNIDDQSPESIAFLIERLRECEGVLDVSVIPIDMKKNRLGHLLKILSERSSAQTVIETLFDHSRSLGIRYHEVERVALKRMQKTISTKYGNIRVTFAGRTISPEYEDCRRCALENNVPLEKVMQIAKWYAEKQSGDA